MELHPRAEVTEMKIWTAVCLLHAVLCTLLESFENLVVSGDFQGRIIHFSMSRDFFFCPFWLMKISKILWIIL